MMIAVYTSLCLMGVAVVGQAVAAIVPPPWADPGNNPCASQPGGWQLLYWPGDGKCYKIFHQGPPCPPSMELTPGVNRTALCRCPPGAAQHPDDNLCHPLYTSQPCQKGEYFAPAPSPVVDADGSRWGVCRRAPHCPGSGELFYPRDGQCYPQYGQGPCPRGQLLAPGYPNSPLGECRCDDNGRLGRYYWPATGTCHQHFTAGPCAEKGALFLPEGKCGCHPGLTQYHPKTKLCYQLDTVGPCPAGHHFSMPEHSMDPVALTEPLHATCSCKKGHVHWPADGVCYRPFTRGPCPQGQMFSLITEDGNSTAQCEPLPCPPGRLYFPGGRGCHRVGTQGPCPLGQVVLFQDSVKTSVEGISYQGMCGCATRTADARSFFPTLRAVKQTKLGGRCEVSARSEDNDLEPSNEARGLSLLELNDRCGEKRGYIAWPDGSCQQLYSRGACPAGQWVVPDHAKGRRQGRGGPWRTGKCECLPSFTASVNVKTGQLSCQPPAVSLARYLNTHTDTEAT